MDWPMVGEWPSHQCDPYYPYYEEKSAPPPPAQHDYQLNQTFTLLLAPPDAIPPPPDMAPKGDNPREIRNKAEKQRRDKMNKSIAQLAAIVPPVVATGRKMDKTRVLNLTAHYLRAHQYVFGDSINSEQQFSSNFAHALLGHLKGFIITTTYKGIVVVVSQNVQQYLGYTELELIGQSIFGITHEDDRKMLKEQLMPKDNFIGPNGELLIPDGPGGEEKVAEALGREQRRFVVRFKKLGQRTEPSQYVTCHVQGTLRKSDKACRNSSRCCQMVRRVRARGDNPCSSGNDVVFIGLVRPTSETFANESRLESFRMEYRTRHSIDGGIIECESRIALVTGYMTHEVNGLNAMNFMHRDDVRWVIIALREMYDQHRLVGESCYRLMTKSGNFIYMQTRGFLDVDKDSRAVTSFVCTNTVVEESVGKRLIKLMKKKFTLLVNNGVDSILDEDEESRELSDGVSPIPVEDPRQLQKVILHLVTDLPSPQPPDSEVTTSPSIEDSFPQRLAIIPPRKERIVSAIKKIYGVIKTFNKDPITRMEKNKDVSNDAQEQNEENLQPPVEPASPLLQDLVQPQQNPPSADTHSIPRSITIGNTVSYPATKIYTNSSDQDSSIVNTPPVVITEPRDELEMFSPMPRRSSDDPETPSRSLNESNQSAPTDRRYIRPSCSRTMSQTPREIYPGSNTSSDEHYVNADEYPQFAPLMPRFISDEQNNNFPSPDPLPSINQLRYTGVSSVGIDSSIYEYPYLPYQRRQFEVSNVAGYGASRPNYPQPECTVVSGELNSGCGTKRRNESLIYDESANKKMAQSISELLSNEEQPLSTAGEAVPLSTAIEAVPLGSAEEATPLVTVSAVLAMSSADEAVPLISAEEHVNSGLLSQGNEGESSETVKNGQIPDETKDPGKFETEDSSFYDSYLENDRSLDVSLDEIAESEFPDERVLEVIEELDKKDKKNLK
ncbi:unnamed protein product, partial [Iphiclides podalirius]